MKNPFNAIDEREKFEFFDQMKENINRWFLEIYPQFDSSLMQKLKQSEINQDLLTQRINSFKDKIPEIEKQLREKIIEEINIYLKKERPDIDRSLKLTAKRLEKKDKDLDQKNEEINEKLKSFKVYESLCEDVYNMRDEMKKLRKDVIEFTDKIKKVFK